VSCTSASNCWAVGYDVKAGEQNEALHWNGSTWKVVTTPQPGGTAAGAFNSLFGVRCIAASSCWAVGTYGSGGAELNQALFWNGSAWSMVPTPNPAGSSQGDFNNLFDVGCTSASNCWAVGQDGVLLSNGETIFNQILHWDGSTWSYLLPPQPGGNSTNDASALQSVRCQSANACWAVGTYGFVGSPTTLQNEILIWDGSEWVTTTAPNPAGTAANDVNTLSSVTCSSAGGTLAGADCWAVGTYGTETNSAATLANQTLHWHNNNWTLVGSPDPDGTGGGAQNGLFGVSCTSTSNCWAVGYYGYIDSSGQGLIANQALRWNGHAWSLVSTPQPAGTSNQDENKLESVRCATAKSCWAVGTEQPAGMAEKNQALHWNGSTWSTG
jgi:hypothetical protein